MQRLFALAGKDLRLLTRDKAGFFFTYFFPFLFASFFGMVFGGMGRGATGIEVDIVDEDQTQFSMEFARRLEKSDELAVMRMDKSQATDRVRRGKRVAFILIPKNFGDRFTQPFRNGMPQIELGLDPARKAESGMLVGILTKHLMTGMVARFTDKTQMVRMIDDSIQNIETDSKMDTAWKLPLRVFLPAVKQFFVEAPEGTILPQPGGATSGKSDFFGELVTTTEITPNKDGPKTSYDITFPQGIIWGLLSCAAGFGISMVSERTGGTLVRLRMGPLSARHILGGKALACFITCMSISTLLFVFGRVVFNVRPDSILLLAVAIFCSAICFVGIMMLISVLGRTEQAAGSIGWGILSIMAMIGGGMVPLMFMPPFFRTLSHISPIKWSIYAMEGAIWRGFSAGEMIVPCAILVGFGVVCFAIGTRWFRWTEEG